MLRGQVDKIPNLSGLKEISVEEVLETKDSQSLRVVVDGPPGIGKTTLCRKLFKMWSNGEIKCQQYDLVLYCALRDSRIANATTLAELLEAVYESDKVPEVVAWLSNSEGKGLLIIYDGWDELDEQSRKSSLAARIFCRKTLDQCAVIITSRSYASSSLLEMDTHSKHVQVIGFSEEEVNTVIINTLQKDSKLAQELLVRMKEYSDDESLIVIEKDSQLAVQLINEVKIRTDVQSLCYIPLVCSMVIFVYKKEKKLPKTLTQLYETFILLTIKRHIKNRRISDIDHKKILQSLDNLPPLVKQPFQEMCRLAYTSLKNETNKMTFSSDQLQGLSEAAKEDYLGLMTSFEDYEEWYQFIHLTIQEFLAACWIVKYEDSPKTVFKQHFDNDHFRMCLRFVAGLTQLKHQDYQQHFTKQLDLQCKTRFRALHDSWFVSKSTTKHYTNAHFDEIPIFLFQLLYESQNTKLCEVLAQSIKDSSLCLHNVQLSSFDVMCLSFFIGNSNITWNHLDMRDISAGQKICQRLSIFVDGLANKTAISCEKFEVILHEPAEKKEIVSLLQLHFLNNIEEFYFTGHSMYLTYPLFRLPKIKVLHINVTANVVYDIYETGDSPDLEKCIESNTTLQELDIMFQTVWPVPARLSYIVSAIKGLTRNKSIKSFSFQHLFQLLFSDELPSSDSRIRFLQKADGVIEDLLKYNKTLKALSLSAPSSHCSPPILNIEEVNTPLTALCINSNMVASLLPHINGLQHLALTEPLPLLPPELNSLPPSLQTLELKLESKSAAELFNILQSNTTLKRLRVSMTFTDDRSIGISLQDMLTRNQTLQYLHIIMNTAFMPFLTTGLENNTSLQQLTVPVMLYPDDDDQLRTFFNVISQKINLIKLGLTFTTDPLHDQLLDEEVDDQTKPLNNEKVELTKTLLYEQVLPAVTSMLQSHTTMRLLEMEFSDITDTDAFVRTIQISHHMCTDQFRSFYKTIFNHVSLECVSIARKVILEKSFKEQEKARLQQEAPH